MLAFNLALQLILLIILGIIVWRSGMVGEDFDKSLTSFIINLALPCLIINSFNAPFSKDQLINCLILLALSLLILAVSFAVGQLCFKLCGGGYSGRILRFGAMFTNFSFVGIPVVEALYGQLGVLYFVVFLVPIRMVYYSGAKPLLSPHGMVREKKTPLQTLAGWFSPPVIAVFIGLFLYVTGLRFPSFIDNAIETVGSISSPLGMIVCGISLGKNNMRSLLKLKYLRMPILRNLIMPALTVGILYFLPLDPLVAKVVVMFSALPVAALLSAFTIQYDPRPEAQLESSGSVMLSVLASAATIPLWSAVAERLF
ncbi:MAG: AEC family transporter [Oscillospiraceae bacterium]